MTEKYCPGFLYCKQDNICGHHDDICDGIIHCGLSLDDEYDCHPGHPHHNKYK